MLAQKKGKKIPEDLSYGKLEFCSRDTAPHFTVNFKFRTPVPDDAADCVWLRGQTRENAVSPERLASLGITIASWGSDIRTRVLTGYICTLNDAMIGYCFGSTASGEIVVLALLPEYEGHGVGKQLLSRVIGAPVKLGKSRFFLGCSADPKSRSYAFYRHLGWRPTGEIDRYGDEILQYYQPAKNSQLCNASTLVCTDAQR